ncbi:MAG: hypothetical protein LQ351_001513 [Letrouitia transgressa]|nr:MAG: hypothetical protein LQ351_001513 [Letrouitia transgressa]
MLKSLKLSRKQKLGLMVLFGLGGFVIVVSSLRLHAISEIFGPQGNKKFTKPLIDIWSGVEMCVGIICACAPVLKSFIVHYKPRFFGTTSSQDDQSTRQPATKTRWSPWSVSWCPSWQRLSSKMSGPTDVEDDSYRASGIVAHNAKSSMVTQTKAYFPPPPTTKPSVSGVSTVSKNVYPTTHKNSLSSTTTTSTTPGPGSNSIQPLSPSVMGRTNSPASSDVAQEISARVLRFSPRAPQVRPIHWWSETSEVKRQGWG